MWQLTSQPQRATTLAMRCAVWRFAVRRGLVGIAKRPRAVKALAALYLVAMAAGVWSVWGNPRQVAFWLLVPPLALAISPFVSIGLVVVTSESWYYAPQRGQRAMLMMWPTRPPKGWNAGNFAAEPRHEGLGGTLAHAWLEDLDRHGRAVYITAADDELVKTYRRWGFTDRNAKRGMIRRPQGR